MGRCGPHRAACIYTFMVHDRPADLCKYEMVKFYSGFRGWERWLHVVFYPCEERYIRASYSLVFALQRVGTLYQTTDFAGVTAIGKPGWRFCFYNAWAMGFEYKRHNLIKSEHESKSAITYRKSASFSRYGAKAAYGGGRLLELVHQPAIYGSHSRYSLRCLPKIYAAFAGGSLGGVCKRMCDSSTLRPPLRWLHDGHAATTLVQMCAPPR